MQDWYVIINSLAGSGKTMDLWEEASLQLKESGIGFKAVVTEFSGHCNRLAVKAVENGYRNFIAVGGDGSVHEMLNGIMSAASHLSIPSEDFVIGVLPTGTGNDWLRSLGIKGGVKQVVSLIRNESFIYQDLVKVKGSDGRVSYMVNIGGVGFDSIVCNKVNSMRGQVRNRKRSYLSTLIDALVESNAIDLEITADDNQIFNGRCYSIAVGNGSYSGNGMRQTSAAVIDDGLIDYVVVPKISMMRIVPQLPCLYLGNLHKSKDVVYGKCSNLVIRPLNRNSEVCFEVDGEIDGRIPLEVSMTNHSIRVLGIPTES